MIHDQLISSEYELHRDEFLYLDQAHHLAWGFSSVPPFTSWISYLILCLGNSMFWIKFFPALFGALTIVVVWKTIELLKGNLFALIFGSCCLTFSVLFRLNILYQPNSFDVLSWTLVYYFIIQYLQQKKPKYLYFMAIAFAIGFLNKYNISFLLLGLIPAVLLTKERELLWNRHFYYCIGLAFLIISPNLIWQLKHDFPVVSHFKELSETQLVHVSRWSFIYAQTLFFPFTFLVILMGWIALISSRKWEKYRLFFWSFCFTLAIFLLFKAKDYYAIGIYPIYFAFGAVYISQLLDNKVGRFLKPLLIGATVLIFISFYDISYPNRSPEYIKNNPDAYRKYNMLRWEDGKQYTLPQDYADMLGWKELARKVDSLYSLSPNPKKTLVLCDNYGQAGAINYYSKQAIQAVSFNDDYINWFNLSMPYMHLIRVKNAWESATEVQETAPFFEHYAVADSITHPYARERGTTIFTFNTAKIDINKRIQDEIRSSKK